VNKTIKKLMEYDLQYELGKSLVEDAVYDKLKAAAKEKYPNDSYFKTVGCKLDESAIQLPYIMGSLDKVNTENIFKWTNGKGYLTASEKVDGVSILCKWEKGKPTFLAKRGDGQIGQDITSKAKYFIPNINTDDTIYLRGEAVLTGDAYKKLSYANNRNGTAGLLNQKDSKVLPEILGMVQTYFYEIVDSPYIPKEEYERFLYIKSLGLQTPEFSLITTYEMKNLLEILVNFIVQSKKYKPYEIDGIVLAKNISDRENVLFPTNKIAFKMKSEEVTVTVNDVKWQTSRFGKLKPVITIDPISLGGVTVTNVTGFNASYILDNGIGSKSELSLIRAGDVIPHITGVIKPTKANLPKRCPSCNGPIKIVGDDLICQSVYCSESGTKRAMYFLKTIGIKGYSESTLTKLGIEDIFDITNFTKIGRVARWTLQNRYMSTFHRGLRNVPAYKVLAGFGIPGIGEKVALEICNEHHINNNSSFMKLFNKDLVINVGTKTTQSFKDNIGKYENLFHELVSEQHKMVITQLEPISSGLLSGLTFVITGTLPVRRSTAIEIIEGNGGKVVSSVSPSTTGLISNLYNRNTTVKFKKAKEYNIPIIDWYEFRRKYNL
jgi:DNA ligase (NAD+)